MLRILFLSGLIALVQTTAQAVETAEARHLLGRAGFAAEPQALRALSTMSYEDAVRRLVMDAGSVARQTPPAWVDEPLPDPQDQKNLTEDQRKERRKLFQERGEELRLWWLREMLTTPTPLTERMTLFWHGHFTSDLEKAKAPQLMYRQNVLLRREALGDFAALLHAIAHDPAMALYLDGLSNHKGHPNENFAREILELFTLGEGHYSEDDIKQAARAFTGWRLDRPTMTLVNEPKRHDDGEKTFLGQTGNFDSDGIINVILAQPQTARFIVTKLWREFIDERPDPVEVERLAVIFRDSKYQMKPLLIALFTAPAFRAPAARGALVKSPIDVVVGTARMLEWLPDDLRPVVQFLRGNGQVPLAPPNVRGWPGGTLWLNANTLLGRWQALDRMADAVTKRGTTEVAKAEAMSNAKQSDQMMAEIPVDEALGMPVSDKPNLDPWLADHLPEAALALPPQRDWPERPALRLRTVLLDPSYQVK